MKKIIPRKDLLFYYQTYDLPKNLIPKDILIHRDLLFNPKSEEPDAIIKQKVKLSSCFYLDDQSGTKRNQTIGKSRPIKNKENTWRKNEQEEEANESFFDNFKGRTDERQVEKFKRNLEMSETTEHNISIQKNLFIDHTVESDLTNLQQLLTSQPMSAENFFDNADVILGSVSSNSKPLTLEVNAYLDPNPDIVNIKLIYKVNKFLGINDNERLWYIFHPGAKSSFGPLSSINIEDMYNSKAIKGQSEIRLIDIFNIKDQKPFSYFKLKTIEKQDFLSQIEFSPLLVEKIKKTSDEKITHEQSNVMNEEQVNKPQESNITKVKETKVIKTEVIKKKNKSEYGEDSIYSTTKKENAQSNEDTPKIENDKQVEVKVIQKKTIKKVPKSKPLDMEVKLGFEMESESKEVKQADKALLNQSQSKMIHNQNSESQSYSKGNHNEKYESHYHNRNYYDSYYYYNDDYNHNKGGNYNFNNYSHNKHTYNKK